MTQHTFAILAYKESPHLQECIDSLKNQALKSAIIICTSTPSIFLEKIARENNLQLLINPNKEGIASDWNFALKKTDSKFITLAHQDDIYSPQYLKEIISLSESKKDILIAFSNYNEIVDNKKEVFIRENSLNFFIKKTILLFFFRNKNYKTSHKEKLLALGSPIGCPTVTFNKKNIGDFEFDKDFSINMDWKAWHDLAKKTGGFLWVKKTLMSHRIYAGSETSHGIAENRRQNEDLRMFEKIWPSIIAKSINKIYSLSYKNNEN